MQAPPDTIWRALFLARSQECVSGEPKTPPAGRVFGDAPYGIRTRVLALRGPRPRPLDEWSECSLSYQS